jgi:hypothetical protein
VTDLEAALAADDDGPVRRTPATRKKKVLAGMMAVLLLITIAGSLRGGSGNTGTTTTTTAAAGEASTTSTTADRQALIDAGIALTLALSPSPPGNVTGAANQNEPATAVVDIVGVGWFDRSESERFVFIATRGGPPRELGGCLQLLVEYAPRGVGEINLGEPCAVHGAFERGRMGGFLLPAGALWILQLVDVEGLSAESGALATRFFAEGAETRVDTAPVPVDAAPVPADLAEGLLPLVNFREANPPDGTVAN